MSKNQLSDQRRLAIIVLKSVLQDAELFGKVNNTMTELFGSSAREEQVVAMLATYGAMVFQEDSSTEGLALDSYTPGNP